MTMGDFKNLCEGLQSIATITSFIVGGIWVYRRYIRQQERYPNINFTVHHQCHPPKSVMQLCRITVDLLQLFC